MADGWQVAATIGTFTIALASAVGTGVAVWMASKSKDHYENLIQKSWDQIEEWRRIDRQPKFRAYPADWVSGNGTWNRHVTVQNYGGSAGEYRRVRVVNAETQQEVIDDDSGGFLVEGEKRSIQLLSVENENRTAELELTVWYVVTEEDDDGNEVEVVKSHTQVIDGEGTIPVIGAERP